jgi:hypothetical protein
MDNITNYIIDAYVMGVSHATERAIDNIQNAINSAVKALSKVERDLTIKEVQEFIITYFQVIIKNLNSTISDTDENDNKDNNTDNNLIN